MKAAISFCMIFWCTYISFSPVTLFVLYLHYITHVRVKSHKAQNHLNFYLFLYTKIFTCSIFLKRLNLCLFLTKHILNLDHIQIVKKIVKSSFLILVTRFYLQLLLMVGAFNQIHSHIPPFATIFTSIFFLNVKEKAVKILDLQQFLRVIFIYRLKKYILPKLKRVQFMGLLSEFRMINSRRQRADVSRKYGIYL